MEEKSPKRKQLRLKEYDYSQEGYYFITICTKNRKHILSKIKCDENNKQYKYTKSVGVALQGDPKKIELTKIGLIIKKYIKIINRKFEKLFIDTYVIMPNHIHLIIIITETRVAQECDPYNT